MLNFGFLLADDATNTGSIWPTVIIFAILILFFVFMSFRNKKQEKKDAEMRDSLQIGDEVTTIGGIIGKVVSVKGDTFVLESTKDKTKIRFLKGAIRTVDVKAADIAAAIMAEKAEAEAEKAEVEAPAEEVKEENK